MKSFLILLLSIALSQSVIPPTFKKCNRKDPNFNTCLRAAVEDAFHQLTKPFKEVNLPSLEPLEIDSLVVKGRSGVVFLDLNFKNCKIFGPTQAKIGKFDLDFEKKTLGAIITIPKMVMNCQYVMNGRILVISMQGKGDSSLTFENFLVTFSDLFNEFQKENWTLLRLMEEKGDLDTFPESLHVHFENLFNGNEALGDHVNQVLNDNSLTIYRDIKEGFNGLIKDILVTLFNKAFQKISEEEAFN